MNRFWVFILGALLVGSGVLRAEDPDEAYLEVYSLVEQADALSANGKSDEALAKYRQAQIALRDFQRNHAEYKPKLVTYRANYLAQKITELSNTNSPAQRPGGPAGSRQGSANTGGSALPGGIVIKLIDPGAEPRKPLRLHPKEGDKQACVMTMKMSMEMAMGDIKNPEMKLPAMIMTMATTVKSVSADGDINYEMVMTDATVGDEPGVLPQVAEAVKTSLGNMKGLSSSGTRSSRGVNKATNMKMPSTPDAQTRQVVDQVKESFAMASAPLPDEPVGAGAKWEVKMPLKSGGIQMDQTATYQIVSFEEDKLVAKTTLTQRAANQKVENPSMPGVKLDLTRMNGTGSGETTIDLGKIVPLQVTMTAQSEAIMAMNSGAQKQEITVKVKTDVGMETK